MQTIVALAEERQHYAEGTQSIQHVIATPIERSSPPPPPVPVQPTHPDEPTGRTLPFWTWFIENPRPH